MSSTELYICDEVFNFSDQSTVDTCVLRDIEPVIKTRKNALGEDEWKRRHGYNMRWKAETMFSAVKRRIGESVRSFRPDLALKEAESMFVQYSLMKEAAN